MVCTSTKPTLGLGNLPDVETNVVLIDEKKNQANKHIWMLPDALLLMHMLHIFIISDLNYVKSSKNANPNLLCEHSFCKLAKPSAEFLMQLGFGYIHAFTQNHFLSFPALQIYSLQSFSTTTIKISNMLLHKQRPRRR